MTEEATGVRYQGDVGDRMMSDQELEAALEQLPGERVTWEMMEPRIQNTQFMILPGTTVTICNLTIDNGYSVRGEAACVDPANFDPHIGEKYAYDAAVAKLWPLFGFLLAEKRMERERTANPGQFEANAEGQ